VLHVRDIIIVRPDPAFVPPEFRSNIAHEAVLCWQSRPFALTSEASLWVGSMNLEFEVGTLPSYCVSKRNCLAEDQCERSVTR
jgi:hypothetical protein